MNIAYIELLGQKRPLCWSASAMEEIADRIGDFETLGDKMTEGTAAQQFKVSITLLEILLKAGRRYCKVAGVECPEDIDGDVADIIDIRDLNIVKDAIMSAMTAGTKREVEARSKNVEAAQDD